MGEVFRAVIQRIQQASTAIQISTKLAALAEINFNFQSIV